MRREFECNQCSFRTSSQISLNRHTAARHSAARPFVCSLCEKSFKIKTILQRHVKRRHAPAVPSSPENASKLQLKKFFKCPHCTFVTAHKSSLNSHQFLHYDDELVCPSCDYTTKSPKTLSKHRLSHLPQKRYNCSLCAYACNDGAAFRKHSSRHTGIRALCCPHCPYSTSDKSNLTRHCRKYCPNNKLNSEIQPVVTCFEGFSTANDVTSTPCDSSDEDNTAVDNTNLVDAVGATCISSVGAVLDGTTAGGVSDTSIACYPEGKVPNEVFVTSSDQPAPAIPMVTSDATSIGLASTLSSNSDRPLASMVTSNAMIGCLNLASKLSSSNDHPLASMVTSDATVGLASTLSSSSDRPLASNKVSSSSPVAPYVCTYSSRSMHSGAFLPDSSTMQFPSGTATPTCDATIPSVPVLNPMNMPSREYDSNEEVNITARKKSQDCYAKTGRGSSTEDETDRSLQLSRKAETSRCANETPKMKGDVLCVMNVVRRQDDEIPMAMVTIDDSLNGVNVQVSCTGQETAGDLDDFVNVFLGHDDVSFLRNNKSLKFVKSDANLVPCTRSESSKVEELADSLPELEITGKGEGIRGKNRKGISGQCSGITDTFMQEKSVPNVISKYDRVEIVLEIPTSEDVLNIRSTSINYRHKTTEKACGTSESATTFHHASTSAHEKRLELSSPEFSLRCPSILLHSASYSPSDTRQVLDMGYRWSNDEGTVQNADCLVTISGRELNDEKQPNDSSCSVDSDAQTVKNAEKAQESIKKDICLEAKKDMEMEFSEESDRDDIHLVSVDDGKAGAEKMFETASSDDFCFLAVNKYGENSKSNYVLDETLVTTVVQENNCKVINFEASAVHDLGSSTEEDCDNNDINAPQSCILPTSYVNLTSNSSLEKKVQELHEISSFDSTEDGHNQVVFKWQSDLSMPGIETTVKDLYSESHSPDVNALQHQSQEIDSCLLTKSSFRCTECDFETLKKREYNAHCKTHRPEKPYACKSCTFRSKYKCSVVQHYKLKHKRDCAVPRVRLSCNYCEFVTTYESSLRRHVHKHKKISASVSANSVDGYTGGIGETETSFSRWDLNKDKKIVTASVSADGIDGPANYSNSGLEKREASSSRDPVVGNPSELPKHGSSNGEVRGSSRGEQPRKGKAEVPIFRCRYCPLTFVDRISRRHHALRHRQEMRFGCSVCGYRTESSSVLKYHVRRHLNKTDLAANSMLDEELLSKYTDVEAKKRKRRNGNLRCALCNFACVGRSTLVKHRVSAHPDQPGVACRLCDASFTSRKQLQEHQASKHASHLPHGCPSCSYRTGLRYLLERHLLTHARDAPLHACTRCSFTSRAKSSIVLHARAHGGGVSFVSLVAGGEGMVAV